MSCVFKFDLILIVDLILYIKLDLNYEILNLDLIKFILICHIWDLVDYVYILTINLKFWTKAYSRWDIFVGFIFALHELIPLSMDQ